MRTEDAMDCLPLNDLTVKREKCRLRIADIIEKYQTCLSDNVNLILKVMRNIDAENEVKQGEIKPLVIQDGNIDWVYIADVFCQSEESNMSPWERSPSWYLEHTKKLVPFFEECERWLISIADKERANLLADLAWLREVDLIPYCTKAWWSIDSSSTKEIDVVQSLLLLSALMEGSLRILLSGKKRNTPMLLRDILASSEFENIFGKEKVLLLQLIMGSPHSLNLRNLSWHGFLGYGELPSPYVASLIVICGSLGRHLLQIDQSLPNRTSATLPSISVQSLPVTIPEFDEESVKQIINDSSVLFPAMKPFWLQAVDHYAEKNYGLCSVLLLPQLEHLLRTVFAGLENERYAMTADSSVFYVTYDSLLCPPVWGGWDSSWLRVLGKEIYSALRDLLCFPDGPQFRDKISHGECCIAAVPKEWTAFTLAVSLHIIDSFRGCYEYRVFDFYKSIYHPSSILQRKIADAIKTSGGLDNYVRSDRTAEQKPDLSIELLLKSLPPELRGVGFDYIANHHASNHKLANLVETFALDSVFQFSNDTDVPNITSSIKASGDVVNFANLLSQILDNYAKLADAKILRSRQRQTYENMLKTLPKVFKTIRVVMVISVACLVVTNPLTKSNFAVSDLGKLLKLCQRVMEQMLSDYSDGKNRWDEALKRVEKFFNRIEELCNNGIALNKIS